MWGNRHSNKDHHWTLAKTGNRHYRLSGFHIKTFCLTVLILQKYLNIQWYSQSRCLPCVPWSIPHIYALTFSNGWEGTHSGAGPSNSGPHHSTPKAILTCRDMGAAYQLVVDQGVQASLAENSQSLGSWVSGLAWLWTMIFIAYYLLWYLLLHIYSIQKDIFHIETSV